MPLPIVISISFHLLSIIGLHTCTLRAQSLSLSLSHFLSLSFFLSLALSLFLSPTHALSVYVGESGLSVYVGERALSLCFSLAVVGVAAINKFALAAIALKMLHGAAALSCQLYVVVVLVVANSSSNNCENKQQTATKRQNSVVMQSQK